MPWSGSAAKRAGPDAITGLLLIVGASAAFSMAVIFGSLLAVRLGALYLAVAVLRLAIFLGGVEA